MTQPADPNEQPLNAPPAQGVTLGPDGEIEPILAPETDARGKPKRKQKSKTPALTRALQILVLLVTLVVGFWGALVVMALNRPPIAPPPPVSTALNGMADAQRFLLANYAEQALSNGDPELAIKLSLHATQGLSEAKGTHTTLYRTLLRAAYAPSPQREYFQPGAITDIDTTADGATLAIVTNADRNIKLMNPTTGEVVRAFGPPNTRDIWGMSHVAISPDGRFAATAGGDFTIYCYDAVQGKLVAEIKDHTGPISDLVFSADSKYLVSAGQDIRSGGTDYEDRTIRLWDVQTWKEFRRFDGHERLSSARLVGTNKVIGMYWDSQTSVWDAAQPDKKPLEIKGELSNSTLSAISPNGRFVAYYGLADGLERKLFVRLIDHPQAGPGTELIGQAGRITRLAFTPDEVYLASGDIQGTVILWDFAIGRPLRTFEFKAQVTSLAFSPDGRYMFVGVVGGVNGVQGYLHIVPLGSAAQRYVAPLRSQPTALALSLAGEQVAVSFSGNGGVGLLSATSGQMARQITEPTTYENVGVAFSPDGRYLAVGPRGAGPLIRLQDLSDGTFTEPRSSDAPADEHRHLAFSPTDPNLLLTSAAGGKALLWDMAAGKVIAELVSGQNGDVTYAGYMPDAKTALVVQTTGHFTLWDIAQPTPVALKRYWGDDKKITAAALAADGKTIATGYDDGTVQLWDAAQWGDTLPLLQTIKAHTAPITALAFTSDNQMLLSGASKSADNLTLWAVASGMELFRYEGHTDAVYGLAVHNDTAYSIANDFTLRAWRLPGSLGALRAWAQARHPNLDFTCEQRARYAIEPLCP